MKIGKLYRATKAHYAYPPSVDKPLDSVAIDQPYQIVVGDLVMLVWASEKESKVQFLHGEDLCEVTYFKYKRWNVGQYWDDFYDLA